MITLDGLYVSLIFDSTILSVCLNAFFKWSNISALVFELYSLIPYIFLNYAYLCSSFHVYHVFSFANYSLFSSKTIATNLKCVSVAKLLGICILLVS